MPSGLASEGSAEAYLRAVSDGARICDWGSRSATHRLNAISPYFTMYPVDFPGPILESASSGEWVLDPFSGRGTTLFAARVLGLPAVGVDTSAVAVATSAAKLCNATSSEVIALAEQLVSISSGPIPRGEFWELCYAPQTLRHLCSLRSGLFELDSPAAVMLRAVMLGILHGPLRRRSPVFLSNQMPRTFASKPGSAVRYWRKHGLLPSEVDVLDAIGRRVAFTMEAELPTAQGYVLQGDSRLVLGAVEERFAWVVTSPPYLGMRTYVPDQWLRNWFLGGPDTVEYEDPESIRTADLEMFTEQLGAVWRSVAAVCNPGARLHVRIGAIPSVPCEPGSVLKESLRRADTGWEIRAIRPAGLPKRGMRQADQMGATSAAVEEVDCEARLNI